MDRLRHLIPAAALAALALAPACDPKAAAPSEPPPAASRFAAVEKSDPDALASFCEKSFPAGGAGSLAFANPPERPGRETPPASGVWRWVNFWATWCEPCMEEIPLLGKWQAALAKEGLPIALELWSVDEDPDAFEKAVRRGLPGDVRWVRSPADLPPLFQAAGVDPGAPIPVHALVDPAGMLRCVRVGAVHGADWGTVRKILAL